jgi:hypothetical protein
MRRLFALHLASCLCLSATAWADSSADALIESGLRLRREHHDAEALDQFRQAQEAEPSPRAQAQIGFAEQALGDWRGAEADISAALDAQDDAWIIAHADALRAALAATRQHLGSLVVDTNVGGAELWLEGAKVGTLPAAPVRVSAGEIDVEVRAAGYQPMRRALAVPGGGSVAVYFEFATAPVRAAAAEPSQPAKPPTMRGQSAPSTRRFLAWGTLGAAGGLLGAGVAAQIVREMNAHRYNDDTRCLYGDLTRDQRCGNDRARAEAAQGFADVAYLSAGAFAAASLALFWEPSHPGKSGKTTLWLDARASSLQLGCAGDF